MEAFAYRDGAYASSMSTGEALLLRQLASEVLVVLDDPGDFASTSSMVSAATETEQRREAPRERSLSMLLPSMSDDDEDAARIARLTDGSSCAPEKFRPTAHSGQRLEHITHGDGDTLVIPREACGSGWAPQRH